MSAKVYLKIIFSAVNEVKYIKMSLKESEGYVDKIIVTECNRTHTGLPKELLFQDILNGASFTEEEKKRIIYVPGDLTHTIKENVKTSAEMHWNETLIRGYFVKEVKEIRPWDIIVSVDADEIIYHRYWPTILGYFKWYKVNPALFLELHTFFYKPTWLWEDCGFRAPTACRKLRYWRKYPANWRYDGKKLGYPVGGHFSWQLTVDEMVNKLKSYAHSAEYVHLAEPEILRKAINEKRYPFDENKPFHIRELDIQKDKDFYPDDMEEYISRFQYLYEEGAQ